MTRVEMECDDCGKKERHTYSCLTDAKSLIDAGWPFAGWRLVRIGKGPGSCVGDACPGCFEIRKAKEGQGP